MSIFEFVMVTVAIVYGLGLTELLSGIVRVLRGELKADPLHSVWVLSVFLFLVQGVWSLWAYSEIPSWSYSDFLLVLLVPLSLYLAAAVLFTSSGQTVDLGEHFFEAVFKNAKGEPLKDLSYLLTHPDGSKKEGVLGSDGRIFENDLIKGGIVKVEFKSVEASS